MLAGFNRRKKRQSHSFQAISNSLRRNRPRVNRWTNHTMVVEDPSRIDTLVSIDQSVMEAIRIETLALLRDQSPCTLGALAAALHDSDSVMELHQMEESLFGQLSRLSVDGKRRKGGRVDKLKKALHSLEASVESHSKKISSWSEAKELLSGVLEFPDESKKQVTETASLEHYRERLKKVHIIERMKASLHSFGSRWKGVEHAVVPAKLPEESDVAAKQREPELVDDQSHALSVAESDRKLEGRIEQLLKEREGRLESKAVRDFRERLAEEERVREAREAASSLLRPLTKEEQTIVEEAIWGDGPDDEILAQLGSDSVRRESMHRLQPGKWLNDEVIHYFYVMLSIRDEELCRQDSSRKRSFFFKSFFMTKLLNEGNADKNLDGRYEYRNVKRWSKRVPGKDIFKLNKIFFPINQGLSHWICAVVFMDQKRIQMYDSMGCGGMHYLESLFQYLQDEHMDKKKSPMPDLDQWELVSCTGDTPHQRNGFDCGVFTCMFADFLSKDCPLVFSQEHITQCRERIALSIMNGSAII